jgi:hypothetical protein
LLLLQRATLLLLLHVDASTLAALPSTAAAACCPCCVTLHNGRACSTADTCSWLTTAVTSLCTTCGGLQVLLCVLPLQLFLHGLL